MLSETAENIDIYTQWNVIYTIKNHTTSNGQDEEEWSCWSNIFFSKTPVPSKEYI